uniref:Peptidase M13 N-terminal domain-containing protein n=1 Tax=Panagrolaimus superbus TaxID=310955 RepID=A0A914YWF4_9BILA
MTRSIDDKIPICENFYRHTCGKFHFENPSNPNQLINYKTRLDDGLEKEIHDLLTAPSTQPSFSLQFSKGLFNQCSDFSLRESIGAEPLLSLLRNLPCGPLFPGCNGFNEKAFSWERSSGMMDLYAGNLNIIVFDKDTNSQNPQEIILSFKAPDFSMLLDDSKMRIESLQPQSASEFQALLSVQLKGTIINSTITELFGFRWDKNQQGQLEEMIQLLVNLDEVRNLYYFAFNIQ